MQKETARQSLLRKIPWWLHLLFAVIAYCSLKYGVPLPTEGTGAGDRLLAMAPQAAPIVAIAFLFLAASALYRDETSEESDRQENQADDETTPPDSGR